MVILTIGGNPYNNLTIQYFMVMPTNKKKTQKMIKIFKTNEVQGTFAILGLPSYFFIFRIIKIMVVWPIIN